PARHPGRTATTALVALAAAAALNACGTDGAPDRPLATAPAPATPVPGEAWRGAWAASPQPPGPDNWSTDGFADQTLRQSVRVTTGGSTLRIELTHRYGTRPLRIAGATVARTAGGGAVRPGSARQVTFGHGAPTVTVPPGGSVRTDAAVFPVTAFETVTVTLRLAEPTGPATIHRFAAATGRRADGDRLADTRASAFTDAGDSWYLLSGIEVAGGRDGARRDGLVTFGDSITDGVGSTRDANRRYPDALAERLAAAGRPRAVLNHGISGNKVVRDNGPHGAPAVDRFARDVLTEPGVTTVLVLAGINDIGGPGTPEAPEVTVDELVEGHRALIREARAKGLRIVGATLTPIKASVFDTPENEAQRDAFNHWVRTSGAYDAYVDFDRALADPADPDLMRPAFDSGDHLHPSDAGYRAMAEAVDPDIL
ncbi:SGNH/GDSL hydrolase family protein, partial [Streptomyces viridochromogenes]|uniref:SGNH/GDSL hydrolase family protein n=2 Tax=Streptomyces TaxID=1883 RepID=UPI0007C6B0F0